MCKRLSCLLNQMTGDAQKGISTITALTMLAFAIPAARADFFAPWTTVGSGGTVDESNAQHVSYSVSYAQISAAAPVPVSAIIRYNVTAVDGVLIASEDISSEYASLTLGQPRE